MIMRSSTAHLIELEHLVFVLFFLDVYVHVCILNLVNIKLLQTA